MYGVGPRCLKVFQNIFFKVFFKLFKVYSLKIVEILICGMKDIHFPRLFVGNIVGKGKSFESSVG